MKSLIEFFKDLEISKKIFIMGIAIIVIVITLMSIVIHKKYMEEKVVMGSVKIILSSQITEEVGIMS